MRKHSLQLASLLSIVLALVLFVPQRAAADDEDPPGRAARLGYTHGSVSFEPAGTDDWVSAVVNRPMTTGDKLWTDKGARAELHIGSAAIRLSGETGFSILNLTDRVAQFRMTEGTLNIRVRRLAEDETLEIDTPNLAFSILRPGRYRVHVNENGDATMVSVRDGEGEVTGGGSAYTMRPDQQGTFTGTDQLDANIENLPHEDDFDNWSDERDRREDHSVSSRYVSTDAIGYEDLDDSGGWRPVPEYGTVWFPHVTVVGWAPYRYGHWCWVSPWGWTWVDDAPWGFAPFHYGRWVTVRGAWGWVPCPPRPMVVGVVYVRPVYAPALVAWVGGPHFAVGIGFGGGGFAAGVNVGWFPLGPREVFVPSYPVSRTYVNNVNVTNTTVNNTYVTNVYNNTVVTKNVNVTNNVTNIKYVNQGVPGAVTATSGAAFTSAKPVGNNMVKVNQNEVASAPAVAAAPAVAPPKQAVLGAGAANAAKPPAGLQNRAVVAKMPPPPAPIPFAERQEAIKANDGRPLAAAQVQQLQAARPQATAVPVKMAPPAKPAAPRVNNTPSTAAAASTKPGQPVQSNPASNPTMNPSKPGAPPAAQNQKTYNDRPPSARPATPMNANPQLEQRHQQQNQQLQQKQDQERQRIEQKQQQEQQKLQQKNADERRQQEAQQKQQQQLQQLEQKHAQEQQKLQQKQQQEHQKQQSAPKPQPAAKPPKPKDDRPPQH